MNLRTRKPVNYNENDPDMDYYTYCVDCSDSVFEYCSIHGPLLIIPDDKVTDKPQLPAFVPRAALTIPQEFLHLAPSNIPGAGLGVFTTLTLPQGVRFGPYEGLKALQSNSFYSWQIQGRNNRPAYLIDASDANNSNWMRYVNCSRNLYEQNLVAYQYKGQIYYRTIKIIPKYTELLVFYGSEFAYLLNIDLAKYNKPLQFENASLNSSNNEHTKKILAELDNNKQPDISPPSLDKIEKLETLNRETYHTKNASNSQNFFHHCSHCKFKTTNFAGLEKHMKLHDANRKFVCSCGYRFKQLNNLNRHVTSCNFVRVFKNEHELFKKCSECEFNTLDSNVLEQHMRFHDKSRQYECGQCKHRFMTKSLLNRHEKSCNIFKGPIITTKVTSDTYKYCDQCDYKTKLISALEKHVKLHDISRKHVCSACKLRFKTEADRATHMRSYCFVINNIGPHKDMYDIYVYCNECKYKTTNTATLQNHLKLHDKARKHVCSACKLRFNREADRAKHMRSYCSVINNIAPHKDMYDIYVYCNECKFKTTNTATLQNHLKLHDKSRKHVCSACKLRFNREADRAKHMRSYCSVINNTAPHKDMFDIYVHCNECKYKTTNTATLQNHLKFHDKSREHVCSGCQYRFTNKNNLRSHKKLCKMLDTKIEGLH